MSLLMSAAGSHGCTCLLQEPGVWELLDRIKQVVKPYGVQLLCEVHEDFNLNIELARWDYQQLGSWHLRCTHLEGQQMQRGRAVQTAQKGGVGL